MGNSKPFSIVKIIGFLFVSVFLCLLLCYVDNCIVKPHAVFIIEEYSAITLAIWPIQATLSTLSIAFLSIFVNRLEDRYYGLSVKEVLRLCVSWFGINFFEMIFVILLLNGVVAMAAMCNSMVALSSTRDTVLRPQPQDVAMALCVSPNALRHRISR